MTVSRRAALKYTLSATALAGLGTAAAPPKASGDGLRSTTVNAKDYGASGDGTTDDTSAIHAARDAAGDGGKVLIPPGIYLVSGLTASVPDQTWRLSDGAVIKMKVGAANVLTVTGTGVSVVGGVFDCSNGTKNDGSQNGLLVKTEGISVKNVTVQNSPYCGISAYNHSRITISGCTVRNSHFEGIFVQSWLAAPSNIYDILITDNLVDNSLGGKYSAGIGVRGETDNQRVNRVTISRNTVRLPYDQSWETGAISVWNGDDWVVANNIVFGGFLGITCPNPTRAIISDNVVRGFSEIGIEIPGAVDNVTIIRNRIDPDGTSATSGIQASAGTVKDLRILENFIKNFSTSCYLISFVTNEISQQVTVARNILACADGSGSFTGVYFNGSVTGLTMSGNLVDGSSRANSWGVQFLKSVSGASINGNLFSNLAGAAVRLAASGHSYTLDHINVVGNSVVNCAAALKDSTAGGAVVGTNIFT